MNQPDLREHTSLPEPNFEPPAPGRWELETAHHGLRPLSPFLRDAYQRAFEHGIVEPLLALRSPARHGRGSLRPRLPVHASARDR